MNTHLTTPGVPILGATNPFRFPALPQWVDEASGLTLPLCLPLRQPAALLTEIRSTLSRSLPAYHLPSQMSEHSQDAQ